VSKSTAIPHALYAYEVIFGLGIGGLLIIPIINIKVNVRDEDAGKIPHPHGGINIHAELPDLVIWAKASTLVVC